MPSPVTVNLRVNVDASGNLIVFGAGPDVTSNVVEAVGYQLPVNALFDATLNATNADGITGAGLIEFWEPSTDLGNIYAKLASSADFSVAGDASYKRTAKVMACGLERVLVDSLDAQAAAPFTGYSDANYTTCSDFGRLSLSAYAHYLFGHAAATAAITNDQAVMTSMLSLTPGSLSVKDGATAVQRYADWTKKTMVDAGDAEDWDASQSATDANLAVALTKAIVLKGANEAISAVQSTAQSTLDGAQFSTDSLANIVKQVLGQDATRAMTQDNNELSPNVHQVLRFYEGDVIYVSITLKQPGVTVSAGYANAGAPVASSVTEQKYDIKITLGPRDASYDGAAPALYTLPLVITDMAGMVSTHSVPAISYSHAEDGWASIYQTGQVELVSPEDPLDTDGDSLPNEQMGVPSTPSMAGVAGKAVLIQRGLAPFYQKAQLAQDNGALAVVIYSRNDQPTELVGLLSNGYGSTITIPVFYVENILGEQLVTLVRNGTATYLNIVASGNVPTQVTFTNV